jgi:hypothetical protein
MDAKYNNGSGLTKVPDSRATTARRIDRDFDGRVYLIEFLKPSIEDWIG